MIQWIKSNGNFKYVLGLFVALLTFLAVKIYDKVDAMPEKYVLKAEYTIDQTRLEKGICDIQADIKEILKALR